MENQETPKVPKADWSDFEKLKSFGVEQIVKETYMSHESIELILSKNYEALGVNDRGRRLVQSIAVKYDFNLDAWLEEYGPFAQKPANAPSTHTQSNAYRPNLNDDGSKGFGFYLLLGFLILVVCGIVYFFMTPVAQPPQEASVQTSKEATPLVAPVLADAKPSQPSDIQVNTKTLEIVSSTTKRHSRPSEDDQLVVTQEEKIQELLEEDIVIDLNNSVLSLVNNEINITTTLGRLWVGVINTNTFSRASHIVVDSKTLDLSNGSLIITGHGHIDLSSGGEVFNVRRGFKQYFYYKDDSFVRLERKEYLYLNKGIEW